MTRTPLRPLARILDVRAKGGDPDQVESENLRARNDQMRDKARTRAESRLLVLGAFFLVAFSAIGLKMGAIASSEPREPIAYSGSTIQQQRADIVDRNGRILATNLQTYSLYAQPHLMVDPVKAAAGLVEIFPELNYDRLIKDFTGSRKFLWIRKKISPEQMQQVHDIGEPGLYFGPREMRLYPNGNLAAHILGGASFGEEGVHAAEIVGVAGVEKAFDSFLRDPAEKGRPLELSIDLSVQTAVHEVLSGGMMLMDAKGAMSIIMDVHTGEVISMVSLPDFDPNNRPPPPVKGSPADSPIFNRAVQGLYELGSAFKPFTVAKAIEQGLVNENSIIDTKGPMIWGRFRIRDFDDYGATMSVSKIIEKSSNIGTARIALMLGANRLEAFMREIGLLDPSPIELVEAPYVRPLVPKTWSDISLMTISYGHGVSTSPINLAAAYATVFGGGTVVKPTLLKRTKVEPGPRVLPARLSQQMSDMVRRVVTQGTASLAEVPGYSVGGKTGTADKPKETGGGYHKDKVIATFAGVFPTNAPRYVIIVTLDEPSTYIAGMNRRTAGWTAAPVAGEMVRRIAPLLGLRPEIASAGLSKVTEVASRQ